MLVLASAQDQSLVGSPIRSWGWDFDSLPGPGLFSEDWVWIVRGGSGRVGALVSEWVGGLVITLKRSLFKERFIVATDATGVRWISNGVMLVRSDLVKITGLKELPEDGLYFGVAGAGIGDGPGKSVLSVLPKEKGTSVQLSPIILEDEGTWCI